MRVQPRAAREGLAGERAGALLVRVASPPAEGAANRALVKLLARALGVPPSAVRILQGESSRDKLLLFEGVDPELLLARLRAIS